MLTIVFYVVHCTCSGAIIQCYHTSGKLVVPVYATPLDVRSDPDIHAGARNVGGRKVRPTSPQDVQDLDPPCLRGRDKVTPAEKDDDEW